MGGGAPRSGAPIPLAQLWSQSCSILVCPGTGRDRIADFGVSAPRGTWATVYLGSFPLKRPLHYVGIVPISYIIVLSFGGYSTNHLRTGPVASDMAIEGLRAIHYQGILHGDIARRNMLWNPATQRLIWHDFKSAKIIRPRPLTERSVNQPP